jgi:hypothetical protein
LYKATEIDQPLPRLIPVPSRDWDGQLSRMQMVSMSPQDTRLILSHDVSPVPDTKWIPISELVVEDSGNSLIVRTRDGRRQFDIAEALAYFLGYVTLNSFKMLPPQDYLPRITIDRLVVRRETWRFAVNEMPFANELDEAVGFLAARRWQQMHNLPRFVFVKLPTETKPFYVDFASPVYVRVFAKFVHWLKAPSPSLKLRLLRCCRPMIKPGCWTLGNNVTPASCVW